MGAIMRNLRQASTCLGCVLIAAALAIATALPTPALAGTEVDKSETVHVQTDANGTVQSITVDETLANASGASTVKDRSRLRDIVPDDEEQSFTRGDGQEITWSTGGKSVSYKGTSDGKPPVDITVSYRLDGREMQPNELAGATGHLEMRLDYALDTSVSKDADASTTPFVCMTVAFLDGDVFSNVEVENGRVVDDKGSLAVVGLAMPGLEDSLRLEDSGLDIGLDLPEHLSISADVQDFSLDPIYTIVTPELFTDLDTRDFDLGLQDIGEGTSSIEEAVDVLIEGSGALTSGLQQLADGSQGLGGGADALQKALGQLPIGLGSLSTGAHALADGLTGAGEPVRLLVDGAERLNDGAAKGLEVVGVVQSSVESATTAAGSLRTTLESFSSIRTAVSAAQTAATEAQGAAQHASQELTAYGQGIEEGKAAVSEAVGTASGRLGDASGSLADASASLGEASAVLGSISTEGMSDEQIQAIEAAQRMLAAANESLASADAGLGDMVSHLDGAASGLEAMNTAVPESVSQDIATLDGSAETLRQRAGEIAESGTALEDLSTIDVALSEAEGGLAACQGVLTGVVTGSEQLESGISSLSKVLGQLSDGAGELAGGVDRLTLAAPQLVDGTGQLGTGAAQLTEALRGAAEGSQRLTDGLVTFDDQGINELVDSLKQLDVDTDDLRGRLDSLRDAARRYDNFAGKADGQSGSVRFVYKTEQIG